MQKAICLISFVLFLLTSGQSQTSQPAANLAVRKIAFEVSSEVSLGGFPFPKTDIFVRDSPNSKPKRLVEGIMPVLSPDGQKLAFCTRERRGFGQVQLINTDGSGRRELTHLQGGACPTDWSPDGEKILSIAYGTSGPTIFVMGSDGGNLKQITPGFGARWSPDGKRLVFCRNAEGRGTSGSIWTSNSEGTDAAKVIDDNSNVLEVAWFPDGKNIVFSSERKDKRKSSLFRISSDGSGLETIAVDKHLSLYFPVLSPDGTQVVVDGIEDRETNVVLLDLVNHHVKVLARGLHPSVLWDKP